MNIVHIASSNLAGAPGMLSDAICKYTQHKSVSFRCGGYSSSIDLFSVNTLPIKDENKDFELFEHYYKHADIIHIHNFAPIFVLRWMTQLDTKNKKFIYQVHSPKYERPIFDDLSESHGITFSQKLVICHFHPRQFQSFTVVPNCLFRPQFEDSVISLPYKGPLRIFYSPSTTSSGRWSSKTSAAFKQCMRYISDPDLNKTLFLECFENIPPCELSARRKLSDITIDEIVTGSFHLVSYEGLAAGTIVINGADDWALATFQIGFRSPPPPFIIVTHDRLLPTLLALADDRGKVEELKQASRSFYEHWMRPERIVPMYIEQYEK